MWSQQFTTTLLSPCTHHDAAAGDDEESAVAEAHGVEEDAGYGGSHKRSEGESGCPQARDKTICLHVVGEAVCSTITARSYIGLALRTRYQVVQIKTLIFTLHIQVHNLCRMGRGRQLSKVILNMILMNIEYLSLLQVTKQLYIVAFHQTSG